MKDERNNLPLKKTLLILFPHSDLGAQIAEIFAQNGFQIIVVLSDEKIQHNFSRLGTSIVFLKMADDQFWDNLSRDVKKDMLSAAVVIYCAEKDFLKLKSTGKHEEWQIDFHSEPQKRLTFIDQLLNRFVRNRPVLWVNLAVGTSTRYSRDSAYCKTRYGMIGFSKILELNPKFQGMSIRNICLSFFRYYHSHKGVDYCTNCTTEDLRDVLINLDDENGLIRYLLKESENLIHRQ